MSEGWYGDDYFVLFPEDERISASERYGIADTLPGYTVLGLRGWDDLIVQDANGCSFTVPVVPLDVKYLSPCEVPASASLEPDSRFTGKIRWYIKPLVFGGDSRAEGNITWINHQLHAELVVWWNDKYQKLKAG